MSLSQFSEPNGQSSAEIVTLDDELGRSLPCYVEQSFKIEDSTYVLLLPVDAPVAIVAWDGKGDEESAIWIEDSEEIARIFPDAKAVLAERDLSLKNAAFTLTVEGELSALDEEDILTIEIENDGGEVVSDDFQFLANFYNQGQEYELYTPLSPFLFFARASAAGELELLSPEDEEFQKIQPFLEEWLSE